MSYTRRYFDAPSLPKNDQPRPTHRLAYLEWGNPDHPPLFCVHGLTRNSRDFDYLAEALSDHYRVLSIDVAGRGESQWLSDPSDYTYPTYVADMMALLAHLKITTLDWVGTSMGGLIAMVLEASYPGTIRRMVLNDIGPFIPGTTLQRIGKYVSITPEFVSIDALEKYLRGILAPFGITDDAHWKHLAIHSAKQLESGKYILAYDPAIAKPFLNVSGDNEVKDLDLWPLWEKITSKVLILRGALSDALLHETAVKMTETGPKAKLVEFANIGHAPALMEQDQINIVKSWLLS